MSVAGVKAMQLSVAGVKAMQLSVAGVKAMQLSMAGLKAIKFSVAWVKAMELSYLKAEIGGKQGHAPCRNICCQNFFGFFGLGIV